jgi:hypothetical protein
MSGRPSRRDELGALAHHEQTILERHRQLDGGEDELIMQPPSGATGLGLEIIKVKENLDPPGDPGGPTTPCTRVYDIWAATANVETDEPLARRLSPQMPPRTALGEYYAAPAGSFGTAFRNPSTQIWELWAILEEPEVEGCEGGVP